MYPLKAILGMSVYEHPFFPEWLSLEVKSGPQTRITSMYLQVYLRKKVLPRKVG